MSFPKLELNIGPGSTGTVLLDGVDISKGLSAIQYNAEGGKLAKVTLTLTCDVAAVLEVSKETLTVLNAPKPNDGWIESIHINSRHIK